MGRHCFLLLLSKKEHLQAMEHRRVRTSGKALVIKDDCLLALRMHDEDGDFYILPGGGQRAGELLPDTVRREVCEETGMDVRVGDVAFVIEGSEGEAHHRVDVVFRCEYAGVAGKPQHPDVHQTGIAWLPVEGLNHQPLYPSRLRRPVMELHAGRTICVYQGNECVGDP